MECDLREELSRAKAEHLCVRAESVKHRAERLKQLHRAHEAESAVMSRAISLESELELARGEIRRFGAPGFRVW